MLNLNSWSNALKSLYSYLRTSCTSYTDVVIVCTTVMDPKTFMPAFTKVTLRSRALHVTQPYRSVALSKLSTFKSLSIVTWKSKLTAYNFGHIGTPGITYCAPNVVEQYFYSSLSWIATTNESYLKGTWGFWSVWNRLRSVWLKMWKFCTYIMHDYTPIMLFVFAK